MADFYVNKDAGGASDSNGGTDPSSDAWLTIAHAISSSSGVAAGDRIFVKKASTNYSENATAQIDGDTTDGIIELIGYETTIADGKQITCNASVTTIMSFDSRTLWKVSNIIFTGASGHNVTFSGASNLLFHNCSFINSAMWGFYAGSASSKITLTDCVIHSNVSGGCRCYADQTFIRCTFYNNSAEDIRAHDDRLTCYQCVFEKTLSTHTLVFGHCASVLSCTHDLGNGGADGWKGSSGIYGPAMWLLLNNIFYDAPGGRYALDITHTGKHATIAQFNGWIDNANNARYVTLDSTNVIDSAGDPFTLSGGAPGNYNLDGAESLQFINTGCDRLGGGCKMDMGAIQE